MLEYDQRSRRFVGRRYLVTADAFFERVRNRCRAGGNIPEALTQLRDERAWSLRMTGVERLYTAADLDLEAEAILRAASHPR